MKKGVSGILFIIIMSCISFSCNQQKSLQELLQEERKAIDRFINMNDLVILKEYPKDGVFKEKEYFRTSDGMFFHVVDSGNGTRVQWYNDVTVRFKSFVYIKDFVKDSTNVTIYSDPYPYAPLSFVYGIPQTYTAPQFLCQAWVIPLLYVGEEAVVDMIVPSSLGATSDNTYISPVFYKNLRYTRFN